MIYLVALAGFLFGVYVGWMIYAGSHISSDAELLVQREVARWSEPTLDQYEQAVELASELIAYAPTAQVQKHRYDDDLRIHRLTVVRIQAEQEGERA